MKKSNCKRVIGCDLDVSYIIVNKRTRVSYSNPYSIIQKRVKKKLENSPKNKKEENVCETILHDCVQSSCPDTNYFYGFVSAEKEKSKLLHFMKFLEKIKTELSKTRNENCENNLISKLDPCTVDVTKLGTSHNYKIRCLIHKKYNCGCVQINPETGYEYNKSANNVKQQIHKGERNFAVKSTSRQGKGRSLIKQWEYPIKLPEPVDNSIPYRIWCVEVVPGQFTEVVNTVTKDIVTYTNVIQSHHISTRLKKSVYLPLRNHHFTFCDVYGMYAFPKENCYVYFGPYSLEEDHCLKLYKKVGKKKIEVPFKNLSSIDVAYKIVNLEDLKNITKNNVEPVRGMWCINCDDSLSDNSRGIYSVHSVNLRMLGSETFNVHSDRPFEDESKKQIYKNANDNNITIHSKEFIENLTSTEDHREDFSKKLQEDVHQQCVTNIASNVEDGNSQSECQPNKHCQRLNHTDFERENYTEKCNGVLESESELLEQSAGPTIMTANKQYGISILKSNCKSSNAKRGKINTNSETCVIKTTDDKLKKSVKTKNRGATCEELKIPEATSVEFCIHKKEDILGGDIKKLETDSLPRKMFSNRIDVSKEFPEMVLLCCTPGIGYLSILEYDETKILFEDPVNVNKLHQFTDVSQASQWLDKYFKSQVQFDENVSLTWRVVWGCSKRAYPMDPKLFTDSTLIVTARGVMKHLHSRTVSGQPGNR